jgi:hypothetical protein
LQVHFAPSPEVRAKLERWTHDTGRPADELLQDALAGYFDELAATREMLNGRYDDLKSGKVEPISGTEVRTRLKAKIDACGAGRQAGNF